MKDRLTDLSDSRLADALEANLAAEMSIFSQGLPAAALHAEQELLWFETQKPALNGIVLTRLAKSNPTYVDSKIATMIAYFKARHSSFSWSIGPATQPLDLADSLKKHGLTHIHTSPAMAIEIQGLPTATTQLDGLTFQEVTNNELLRVKLAIEKISFAMSDEAAQDYYHSYSATGFGKGANWHHYLGRLYNEPVAIASILLQVGVTGIYGVATLPSARRQGIGAAITRHVLSEAFEEGYRIAILTATDMSKGIYQSLGFQDYGTIRHYRWYHDKEVE